MNSTKNMNLIRQMQVCNITGKQLAEMLMIPESTMYSYINNECVPSVSTAIAIAKILGTNTFYLWR